MCVHTHGCIINSMQFYHMYVHITTTTVKIQNCFMITRTIPAPCWHSCSSSLSISRTPAAAAAKSLQSCPTLCDPIDLPGSPVPGILQARTLEWIAISFSKAWKWKVKSESEVAQSCPTLSNPMDCSPPGSSVHGIFQTRVPSKYQFMLHLYNFVIKNF